MAKDSVKSSDVLVGGDFTKLEISKGPHDHDWHDIEFTTTDGRVFTAKGNCHWGKADFSYTRGAMDRMIAAVNVSGSESYERGYVDGRNAGHEEARRKFEASLAANHDTQKDG